MKVCEGQHSQKLVEKSHNVVTLTDGRLVRVIMEIFALSLQKLVSFVQSHPVSFVYKKALKTDIILQLSIFVLSCKKCYYQSQVTFGFFLLFEKS